MRTTPPVSRRNRRAGPDADPRPSPGTKPPGAPGDLHEGVEATVTTGPVSDALDKLSAEHRLMEALFQRGTARSLPRLQEAFAAHIRVEDEVLYPALRRAGGKELAPLLDRAVRAHTAAAALLDRLGRAPTAQRAPLTRELRRTFEEHVKEEETSVFPVALRVLERAERVQLGERMDLLQAETRAPAGQRRHRRA